MAFGIDIILRREAKAEGDVYCHKGQIKIQVIFFNNAGVHWSNIFEPVVAQESLKFGHVIVILLVDCMLYSIVVLYVEKIFPGDYGVPQPWYFPLTKRFWLKPQGSQGDLEINSTEPVDPHNFEPDPSEKAGITIIGLTKVSIKVKDASDVNLNQFF
jgi:ATP-binding cassette, subfamily A (ABC1), member 3